jgi:hypothetical protein
MNLKTLMRYDAYLQGSMLETDSLLRNYATTTTVLHMLPGKDPEAVVSEAHDLVPFGGIEPLISFRLKLTQIRAKIADVIEVSKKDLDALTAKNIILRGAISIFEAMLESRIYTRVEGVGRCHATNVTGDPVQLAYKTFSSNALAFPPDVVRGHKRELMAQAEANSEKIEAIKASEVDYTPEFDFGMELVEMVKQTV